MVKNKTRQELFKLIKKLKRENQQLKKDKNESGKNITNDTIEILKIIFNNSPIGMIYYDRSGQILESNQAFEKIFNIPQKTNTDFNLLKETNRQIKTAVAETLSKSTATKINLEYKNPANDIRTPIQAQFIPVSSDDGEPAGGVGIIENITEFRNIKQQLLDREKNLRITLNSIGDAVITTDLAGKIVRMNPVAEELTGWSKKSAKNEPIEKVFKIINAKTREKVKNPVEKVFEEGKIVGLANHTVLVSKDGNEYQISDSGAPIKDENGNLTGVVLIFRDITKKYKNRQKIRENEYFLNNIFDAIQDGISVLDSNLKILHVNETMNNWYSSNTPLEGKKCYQVYHNRSQPCNPCPTIQCLKSGKTESEIVPGLPGSEVEWIELFSHPIKNVKTGEVEKVVEFVRDITARKKAQEKLSKNRENLKMTLNSIGDAVISTDTEGRIIRMNPVAEKLTGWSYEKARGKSIHQVFKIVNADSRNVVENPVDRVLEEGKIIGLANHTVLISKKGKEYQIADSAAPIKDTKGKISGAVLVFRDVTEEYEMRKALRSSRERLDLAMSIKNEGIWDWDLKENRVEFDDRYYKMAGYEPGDFPFRLDEFKKRVHPREVDYVISQAQEHLSGNIPQFEVEFRFKRKDEKWMWIKGKGKIVEYDDQGNPVRFVGTHTDITHRKEIEKEKKRLQKQLLQKQKLESIGTLAGGIAHDFNNILTVILGFSELAINQLDNHNPVYEQLKSIHESGERAAKLTEQLLLFSRKQDMEFVLINLNDTICRLNKMLNRLIGEDITMQQDLSDELWQIRADQNQLEQVVTNLTVNARDAMPSGGKLKIKTQNVTFNKIKARAIPEIEPGKYVLLSLEDSGIGIPDTIQEKIFDPFFTTKGRAEGTGMGLSVVHGIIKEHNGIIKVYSKEGEGTIFKIYLPAVVKGKFAAKPQTKTEKMENYRGNGENILVVEDEQPVLNYLENIFNNFGYNYLSSRSAEEALQIFKRNKNNIDLLLSDVIMTGMNGVELAIKLKKEKRDLEIILSSGYSEKKISKAEIVEKGFKFIQKPYDILKLMKVIHSTLKNQD